MKSLHKPTCTSGVTWRFKPYKLIIGYQHGISSDIIHRLFPELRFLFDVAVTFTHTHTHTKQNTHNTGLTAPSDLCDAGYVCVSAANNSRPEDGVTGYECLPGYYCPDGSDQGTRCPQGTFSNVYGLENVTECQDCTPGFYCQTEGTWVYFSACICLCLCWKKL